MAVVEHINSRATVCYDKKQIPLGTAESDAVRVRGVVRLGEHVLAKYFLTIWGLYTERLESLISILVRLV